MSRGQRKMNMTPALRFAMWSALSLAPASLLYWYVWDHMGAPQPVWQKILSVIWVGCSAWGLVVAGIAGLTARMRGR